MHLLPAIGIGVAGSLLALVPTLTNAQDQTPETFTLPTATPTPTPAPQGPEDERVGVPIAPRVIPQQQQPPADPTPVPAGTPTPAATPSEAGTDAQTQPSVTTPPTQPPAQRPSPSASQTIAEPSAPVARRDAGPDVSNANARGAGIGVDNRASPGFESLDEELEGTAQRSPDGWYSVDETGSESAAAAPSRSVSMLPASTGAPTLFERVSSQGWLLATLLLLILALAGIIRSMILRRKQEAEATLEAPANVLTAGIRASMKEEVAAGRRRTLGEEFGEDDVEDPTTASAGKVESAVELKSLPPAPPTPPPRPAPVPTTPVSTKPLSSAELLQLDLSLDVISATRSLMRLSVEFSLEVANRSDAPVKDLNIAGELACAKKGAAGPAAIDKTQSITTIERIAPQQCRRVKGTLQLPVSELSTIPQNGKPVLIPLIHLRIGTLDQPAIKRTFVLGTPSSSSLTRVHPLLLDGPPGGLPPLRAQLIKQA